MTTRERYQQCLDNAYIYAPFTVEAVIDLRDSFVGSIPWVCQVCGNKRLRFLCHVIDTTGKSWYMGRECWTKIYNRQFEEKHNGNT